MAVCLLIVGHVPRHPVTHLQKALTTRHLLPLFSASKQSWQLEMAQGPSFPLPFPSHLSEVAQFPSLIPSCPVV